MNLENGSGKQRTEERNVPAGVSRRTVMSLAAVAAASTVVGWPGNAQAQSRELRGFRSRKKRARVRNLQMAYFEIGKGDPIVFLHGNPTSSYLWRNVVPHVEHLGRCIAPDMVGMGDSDALPDSGAGRYTFATHRDYMFDLLETIGVRDRVTLVVHDWGSGVGFSWAQRHPERVKGIVYMEAILQPPAVPLRPEPTAGPFATFRSDAGDKAVLDENMFVEQLLIGGLGHYLSEDDKAEYRRPYLTKGESRRPTLEWPRQLPMAGGPQDTTALVRSYSEWLASDAKIPKLLVHAVPGAILSSPQMLEFVRSFKSQREITVYGTHYVQEMAPHAIGRGIAAWLASLV